MELKKRDIECVANSRTSWRYKWHIAGWAAMLITIGIILSHIYDWQTIVGFGFLGHTYHLYMGALWFFPLAGLALLGCALWTRAQKKEVKILTEQYQGKEDLFYSTFYPERSDRRVKAVVQQLVESREDKEVTVAILACLFIPAIIVVLMNGDVEPVPLGTKVLTTMVALFVMFGGVGLVATLQGKREITILRKLGYSTTSDGKDRKVPIILTAIVLAVAISMIVLGIVWFNPFYLVGGLGFELLSIAHMLFLVHIAPYYKAMQAIMEQETDTEIIGNKGRDDRDSL